MYICNILENISSHAIYIISVLGLCKPTKSTEDNDYEDDTPLEDDDEEDEDEDTDNFNVADKPPQILSVSKSIRVKPGSTVSLPCQVINAGL